MKKILLIGCVFVVTAGFILQGALFAASGMLSTAIRAPEFPHRDVRDWINSTPLTIDDLSGKVVLIDFWTFDCWNCYRSFPWLNAMEARLADKDFKVVGVHTPEFAHEKIHANIIRKVKEFKLSHPIMVDNDSAYWRAMDNRYWPAFYLLDKKGNIRARYFGETHEGDRRAKAIEQTINRLLEE